MIKNHKYLLTGVNFGQPSVNEYTASFYTLMNDAIIKLVRSLPCSVQTSAMIFFMNHAGIEPGQPLDFFRNYYSPIWSSIPHIIQKNKGAIVHDEFIYNAAIAHSMIMILHSLDDHISDGQIIPDHLTLLIRSQGWKIFWDTVPILCSIVRDGMEIVNTCIDRYYASITHHKSNINLEEYLCIFKDQMATALIVPLITVQYIGGDVSQTLKECIRASLESFGVAWRILDDIHDAKDDFNRGRITAVTLSLSNKVCSQWSKFVKAETNTIEGQNIVNQRKDSISLDKIMMQNSDIITTLVKRIIKELQAAAKYAEDAGIFGLSKELHELLIPFDQAAKADIKKIKGL